MTEKTSALQFPCLFPIKIIGKNDDNFALEILSIAKKHFPELTDTMVQHQESKQGSYLSITITVFAENQASLDALYIELNQHPNTSMVL